MFPISDDNPRRHLTPYVSWSIIGICVLAWLWEFSLGEPGQGAARLALGFIPVRFFGYAELPPELAAVPAWATMFTSMFLHGGWLHLGGNMLYLWIFGDNIEDSMGHLRYLIFYLLCGAVAALTQGLIDPTSEIPMVGASGAISGVLGGYILLHPGATVRVLIFLGIFATIMHVPALDRAGLLVRRPARQHRHGAAGPAGRRLRGAYRRLRRGPRAGLALQAPQRASARKAAQPRLSHGAAPRSLGLTADEARTLLPEGEGGCGAAG